MPSIKISTHQLASKRQEVTASLALLPSPFVPDQLPSQSRSDDRIPQDGICVDSPGRRNQPLTFREHRAGTISEEYTRSNSVQHSIGRNQGSESAAQI
ncbi:hypothetical protein VTN49DRAFT_4119 [Thermomyces lanuginosus]|uniref:uncharacterized protein n=1 Tax=Thermomyces lanuginosus TaxID=5541 RepID=UPI0037436686